MTAPKNQYQVPKRYFRTLYILIYYVISSIDADGTEKKPSQVQLPIRNFIYKSLKNLIQISIFFITYSSKEKKMGLQDVLLAVDVGRLTSGLQKINTTKALPIISTAAALLYTSYQLSSYWKSKNSKYKVIPMPTKGYYPIIGHLLSLESEPHLERSLAKWHKETGPIIKLQFGVQSWVFIADATLAHKIFVTNGTKSSGRPIFVFRHNYYSHGK